MSNEFSGLKRAAAAFAIAVGLSGCGVVGQAMRSQNDDFLQINTRNYAVKGGNGYGYDTPAYQGGQTTYAAPQVSTAPAYPSIAMHPGYLVAEYDAQNTGGRYYPERTAVFASQADYQSNNPMVVLRGARAQELSSAAQTNQVVAVNPGDIMFEKPGAVYHPQPAYAQPNYGNYGGSGYAARNGARSEYYNSTASRIGEIQQQRADLYQRRLGNREIAEMMMTPRVLLRGLTGAVRDTGSLIHGINRLGR